MRKWKHAQLKVVVVVGERKHAQLKVVVVVGERKDAQLEVVVVVGERKGAQLIVLVLSCLVSLECTLWEGFFWRMPKQAYTVPCRASHPRGQGAQVLCT